VLLLFIRETVWHKLRESLGGIFMEVIPLCWFLNKVQLFSRTQQIYFDSNYAFTYVLRVSACTSGNRQAC
jgi:hypothetical protein